MSQSDSAVISPRSLRGLLLPVLVFVAVIIIWQTVVVVWKIHPILLPSPILCRLDAGRWSPQLAEITRDLPLNSVLSAGWKIRSDLMLGCGRTAAAAGAGLAMSTLAGILLAFLFSQSAIIRRALYPYAVLLQTIPIIAIAPIVIVAFGRGFFSVSLVAAVISLFPIVTSTTTGLLQIDPNLLDLFRLSGATRLQTLFKLRVPSSLPYLISGIRIASGSAIVGAIVGEFFVGSSQPGLGAMIQMKANSALDMSELYATVLTSTMLGTVSFGAVTLTGENVLRRWFGMSLSGQH
ncbi:MAG: ABC transporter permease [Planctomycetota bacterium]